MSFSYASCSPTTLQAYPWANQFLCLQYSLNDGRWRQITFSNGNYSYCKYRLQDHLSLCVIISHAEIFWFKKLHARAICPFPSTQKLKSNAYNFDLLQTSFHEEDLIPCFGTFKSPFSTSVFANNPLNSTLPSSNKKW